ncbi:hypothetical protein BD311DRAFT_610116, partial [Dichomitus squalens]
RGETPLDARISSFARGGKIKAIPHDNVFRRLELTDLTAPEYTFTPHGIRTKLPVIPLSLALPQQPAEHDGKESHWYLVILGCEHDDYPGALLGQACVIPPSESGVEYLYQGLMAVMPIPQRGAVWPDIFALSPATIERYREHIQVKTVYISQPERTTPLSRDVLRRPHKTFNLVLLKETRDALRAQGYTAELQGPDEDHPTTYWLTLANDDQTITVEYQYTFEGDYNYRRWLRIKATVSILRPASGLAGGTEVEPSSVQWSDWCDPDGSWNASLLMEKVAFALPARQLTMQLSFDFAAPSHYFLRVEVV